MASPTVSLSFSWRSARSQRLSRWVLSGLPISRGTSLGQPSIQASRLVKRQPRALARTNTVCLRHRRVQQAQRAFQMLLCAAMYSARVAAACSDQQAMPRKVRSVHAHPVLRAPEQCRILSSAATKAARLWHRASWCSCHGCYVMDRCARRCCTRGPAAAHSPRRADVAPSAYPRRPATSAR